MKGRGNTRHRDMSLTLLLLGGTMSPGEGGRYTHRYLHKVEFCFRAAKNGKTGFFVVLSFWKTGQDVDQTDIRSTWISARASLRQHLKCRLPRFINFHSIVIYFINSRPYQGHYNQLISECASRSIIKWVPCWCHLYTIKYWPFQWQSIDLPLDSLTSPWTGWTPNVLY